MSSNKDIFGDEMDQEALNAFGNDENQSDESEQLQQSGDEEDYSEIVDQLERGKEVDLDPEKPTSIHKQKKQDRWNQHKQRTEQALQAQREAERRAELAERELQVFRQTQERSIQQTPVVEDNSEENEIYEQQARLYENFDNRSKDGNMSAEDIARFKSESRTLQNKLVDVRLKKMMQQQPQVNVGEQAIQAQLQMQYPDVYGDNRARTYALGLYQTKIATGSPVGVATVKEALNETAKKFKFASAVSEVDEGTKRRFSGPMRGSSAKTNVTPKIPITKEILKIANATYPHLDDEKERLKTWIKVHGKKYAEAIKEES